VLDMHSPADPELLVELARRADAAERDPSRCSPWKVFARGTAPQVPLRLNQRWLAEEHRREQDTTMPASNFDPKSLSVEERLHLIDELRESIEESVARGEAGASRAVEQWTDIDPEILDALVREADECDRDPSSLLPWETLLEPLKRKDE
jgi:hypothetical protein